jgi:hypothetical protein
MSAIPLQSSNKLQPEMGPGAAETARYTKEMLESLRKIALQQEQLLLAHLLDLAALEARVQGESQAQETLFPG